MGCGVGLGIVGYHIETWDTYSNWGCWTSFLLVFRVHEWTSVFFPGKLLPDFYLFLKGQLPIKGKKGGESLKFSRKHPRMNCFGPKGCHLFAWKRTVDLAQKPQCGHPHSLFVTNFNIFSPPFHLVSIGGCQSFTPLCFILSPLLELVFHFVVTRWACVSFPSQTASQFHL